MTTLSDLVAEVRTKAQGYSVSPDALTWLISGISDSDTTFTVADGNVLSRGVAEIDDELVWVDSVDRSNGMVTLAPFGRGWNGTSAATHDANARVTMNPTWPQFAIKNAINDVIYSVYPKIFRVEDTVFTHEAARTTYPLPADCETIVSVTWDGVGPDREWHEVDRYIVDKVAATSEFPSGKTISIYGCVLPGRTVKVVYRAIPRPLTSSSDELSTTAGLPESCRDLVVLGAVLRLTSFIDAGRLSVTTAEADEMDQPKPIGSGFSITRGLRALYEERLVQEQQKLEIRYPIKRHWTR